MSELISLIVPVYNAERYLAACLDSLLNQTYDNIEIVLVNDGSTDSSGDICQQYAEKSSHILVIHQCNKGNTAARKTGVAAAHGKYIGFIDSDDWIDSRMYEVLMNQLLLSNCDVISSGYMKEFPDARGSVVRDSILPGIYNAADKDYIIRNMIYFNNTIYFGINRSLCTKIFKKEMLLPILEQMDTQIQFGEDAACVYSYLLRAHSIAITDEVFYHYRINEGSIMTRKDNQYLTKINQLFIYIKNEFILYGYEELLRTQLNCFLFENLLRVNEYMMDLKDSEGLPFYAFPACQCPKGSKLIIYGAGEVGQSYHKSIMQDTYYQLSAWTDKNYKNHLSAGRNVIDMNSALSSDYDYILLAVKYHQLAEEIKTELLTLKVPADKILWFPPKTTLESYL